jgi:hypothetical protein
MMWGSDAGRKVQSLVARLEDEDFQGAAALDDRPLDLRLGKQPFGQVELVLLVGGRNKQTGDCASPKQRLIQETSA